MSSSSATSTRDSTRVAASIVGGLNRAKGARLVLCILGAALICPIRYWPIVPGTDNTWVFAMNYAKVHGLAHGRDVVWTSGPLGYLVFPQNIGENLPHALIFQGILWLVLAGLFADVFSALLSLFEILFYV